MKLLVTYNLSGLKIIRLEPYELVEVENEGDYIVISGSPIDGLEFHGAFNDFVGACDWAEGEIKDDWWVCCLDTNEIVYPDADR